MRMDITPYLLFYFWILGVYSYGGLVSTLTPQSVNHDLYTAVEGAVRILLNSLSGDACFPVFFTHGKTSITVAKYIKELPSPMGVAVFEMEEDEQEFNATEINLRHLVSQARQLRQVSWCVAMVLVSEDLTFLSAFAQFSLKNRLLVWSTRLLVVTNLPKKHITPLLSSHWSFSMMNTMILNTDMSNTPLRCNVLVHLPYTPEGPQVIQLASWTHQQGFSKYSNLHFFPSKFHNFHGAVLNATALHYEPYWIVSEEGNKTTYSGMDYNLLMAFCKSLNFTYRIIYSPTWDAVMDQVAERTASFSSIAFVMLPNRYEKFHYTRITTTTAFCFIMERPVSKPSWISFFYPLKWEVWLAILITTIVVCIYLVEVTGSKKWREKYGDLNVGSVVVETVGCLLGQGLNGRVSTSQSNQMLVSLWLLFGVIMSVVYRSSLIAFLTLPVEPFRPETIEEFVTAVDRATIEPYGDYFKSFFTNSESEVFKTLGALMDVGYDVTEGLKLALKMNSAHIETCEYLKLMNARHYMRRDGSSPLYVGQGTLIHYVLAWPVPHDAPYKQYFDRIIYSVVEAGLYEYWRKEGSDKIIQESRLKRLRAWQAKIKEHGAQEDDLNPEGGIKSLSIIHMQGPLALLLLGLTLSAMALCFENFVNPLPGK